jgi:DEAD/DEAH box helicase domain-containing protein
MVKATADRQASLAGDSCAAPQDADALRNRLRQRYRDRITGELLLPDKPGSYAEFPEELAPRLAAALRSRGIKRLYSHQRQVWDSVRNGQHTVVVTPTASGKTLCYNLPVLQAVLQNRAKALYLFPTKALAQDQVAAIHDFNIASDGVGGSDGVRAYTFDGDTPGDARKAVRIRGDIVVTNPDMLHQGILPHHTKWAQLFESLRYVVIDELHSYRGVFGSHVANLIRRLKRIARFYGVEPRFILCSATIANPQDLASELIGEAVTLVAKSGAPRGKKHLLLWNPPVVNSELGLRASARSQTRLVAGEALRMRLKTIVFAQTRLMVEVLTKYLKDRFDRDPRRSPRVKAYRGGYLPTERRATERQLRTGHIDCVVSTSALELGVDIGHLDACVLNGYPGTVAGTWQRLGRAGRRDRPSLGVLIATSWPLDQYLVRNPDFFLGASPEHARIDPDQLLILLDHIRCAAFELAFRDGEAFGKRQVQEFLAYLEQEQVLHHEDGQWHWMTDSYPANSVSLRTVAEGNFVVIDISAGAKKIIAEVDYSSAPVTLYEGAIYMVQSQPWQVEKLDWVGRKAFVRQTRADYYTDAIDYTRLKILDRAAKIRAERRACSHGEVHLVRRVAGYKKVRYYTHENVGYGQVNLPDQEMHTTAVWWQVENDALAAAFPSRWQALDGFLGAAYAMHFVAALLTMTEHRDLGRAVGNADTTWFSTVGVHGRGQLRTAAGDAVELVDPSVQFQPTVFLYDNYPGGIGLAATLFDLETELVRRAHRLVAACSCRRGCPACIGPILGSEREQQDPKCAAVTALDLMRDSSSPSS